MDNKDNHREARHSPSSLKSSPECPTINFPLQDGRREDKGKKVDPGANVGKFLLPKGRMKTSFS
jgi:hypothetical protein